MPRANARTERTWELAQARTAEFVVGLDVGLEVGSNFNIRNYKYDCVAMSYASDLAFKNEVVQQKILEQTNERDWEGNCAVLEGMHEGVEYSINERFAGRVAI